MMGITEVISKISLLDISVQPKMPWNFVQSGGVEGR